MRMEFDVDNGTKRGHNIQIVPENDIDKTLLSVMGFSYQSGLCGLMDSTYYNDGRLIIYPTSLEKLLAKDKTTDEKR
jgi:hypothetical protein